MGENCARRGQQTQTNEKITLCNNQTTYLRRYVKNGICLFSFHKKGKGVTVLSTIRMNFATGWLLPVGRMMEWQGYTRSGRPIFTWCSCCLWWWWKSRWTRNRIGWGRGYAQWWWGWWERWWRSCWWWWRWSGYAESWPELVQPMHLWADCSQFPCSTICLLSST